MCWPYKFKQRQAAKLRAQLRPKAFELPPIKPVGKPEIEIHMLCGKKQLDMGIWASWSILRFMDNAILYVHSDGTLQPDDLNVWRKVIQGLIFVSKKEADARVGSEISKSFPLLYAWCCCYKYSAQVIDMHLFGQTDRLIVMDSDVLCFREPMEVRHWVSAAEPACRWQVGIRTCYLADTKLLKQITGLSLPEAFNLGFSLTPRYREKHFDHLEKVLKALTTNGRLDINEFWTGQTLGATCVVLAPHAKPLPSSYTATLGPTSDDMVVRHYVGIPQVRPRYFTEGIPRLLADLAKHNIYQK